MIVYFEGADGILEPSGVDVSGIQVRALQNSDESKDVSMSEIKAITMPRWGLEMMEGTLSAWHVKVGATVAAGQVIMDVESEKIANEVESEVAGTLRRIIVQAGDTVDIGTLLGVIAAPDIADEAIEAFVRDHRPVTFSRAEEQAEAEMPEASPSAPRVEIAPAAPDTQRVDGPHASPTARRLAAKLGVDLGKVKGTGRGGRISTDDVEAAAAAASRHRPPGHKSPVVEVKATPTARRMAEKLGVDLSTLSGTGRGGRISVEDVERAACSPSQEETPSSVPAGDAGDGYEIVKLDTMRKTIARRLVESKREVPHFYLSVDLPADRLLAARAELKAQGSRVTVNDLLLKACALALQDVPEANVQFHDDALHRFNTSDVAFAVATEGGLITPVVRHADRKSLDELVTEIRDLADRGRTGKLAREEFQGGVMTLSNLGMYGIDSFAAVINPPQSAILAVGAARQRAMVRDGSVAVMNMLSATLSCDHRAIDGALGARWLDALRERVASPDEWL